MNRLRFFSNKTEGVTLVELIVSVALIAIIAAPFLGSVYSSVQNNNLSKQKTQAVALAEKAFDVIESQPALSPTTTETSLSISGSGILFPFYEISTPETTTISSVQAYDDLGKQPDVKIKIHIDQQRSIVTVSAIETVSDIETDYVLGGSKLRLNLTQSGGQCQCKLEDLTTTYNFDIDTINSTETAVKIAVSYVNTSEASKAPEIKLNSSYPCEFYIDNDEQNDSGITIINEGNTDYSLIYYKSSYFDPDSPINCLYRVVVTIRKSDGSPVYRQIAYVKK